jgi:hypothetical protein
MIAVRDRILTAVRRSQPISIFGDYVAPAFM